MRLRRETGDFSIHFKAMEDFETGVTIRPNLSPEDLIGVIVKAPNGAVAVVIDASPADSETITLLTKAEEYSYAVATGVVTISE